jgi:ATP-binding cassette subfamily B protein
VLVIVINVILPTLSVYLPNIIIEQITNGSTASKLVSIVLILTLSIAVISCLQNFLEKMIYNHKLKMNSYYIRKIANKGMSADYCHQENEHFRKLQSESFNVCNGHDSSITQIYGTCAALISSALGLTVYLSLLIRLNIFIVLLIVAFTVLNYFMNKRNVRWAADNNKEKIGYQQKINYISRITGDVKYGKDIRLYNMPSWIDSIYNSNIKGLSSWYKRYMSKIFKTAIFNNSISLLREGVVYAYLLYMTVSGNISVSDFVLYIGLIMGFSGWLGGIFGNINSFHMINISINYIRAFLEYPDNYKRTDSSTFCEISTVPKHIELKKVHYRYEGQTGDTLKNINLIIDPSEHLAIVGLNGAGKTTLVKLICGLCEPTSGVILYDGIDIREYNRIEYYKMFSAVFQQFSLLPVTIEEIVSENVSGNIDSQKVKHCLEQAGLWKKINTLENKVKSNYSKTIYDDGVEFSGGEIQKLVLSRALYKDAPVMILDEPTAALDPISENRLYMNYNSLMDGKTTVFISHRLASTRFCKRILLIENGSISEEGTHESLIAAKGKYFNIFEAQAKYYSEEKTGEDEHKVE